MFVVANNYLSPAVKSWARFQFHFYQNRPYLHKWTCGSCFHFLSRFGPYLKGLCDWVASWSFGTFRAGNLLIHRRIGSAPKLILMICSIYFLHISACKYCRISYEDQFPIFFTQGLILLRLLPRKLPDGHTDWKCWGKGEFGIPKFGSHNTVRSRPYGGHLEILWISHQLAWDLLSHHLYHHPLWPSTFPFSQSEISWRYYKQGELQLPYLGGKIYHSLKRKCLCFIWLQWGGAGDTRINCLRRYPSPFGHSAGGGGGSGLKSSCKLREVVLPYRNAGVSTHFTFSLWDYFFHFDRYSLFEYHSTSDAFHRLLIARQRSIPFKA